MRKVAGYLIATAIAEDNGSTKLDSLNSGESKTVRNSPSEMNRRTWHAGRKDGLISISNRTK